MHKLVLRIFAIAKSLLQFLKIVSAFLIMMLILLWIENLINTTWDWMDFITPFLTGLLDFTNSICSISFDFFGATVELKYVSALLVLLLCGFAANLLIPVVNIIEGIYSSTHYVCKKTGEMIFNKQLEAEANKDIQKINNFTVMIKTKIKDKTNGNSALLDEQNAFLNEFITKELNVKPEKYTAGFVYRFKNFEQIDQVIEVLFRVLNSKAPICYAIAIQSGNSIQQLNKLISLENYGKITMMADTLYMYNYNKNKTYETSTVGVFQSENTTIEVHEFKDKN